jgi:eukaryotic-like serine/threonine-protein kinase
LPVSTPAAPGRVLGGRYRLEALLARGGMASVWRAEDSLLARQVAVKTLHPELAVDDSLRLRFRNEAIAVASLAHPDIVATYDTGEDDGVAYFVMELVDGPNLRTLLDERGQLSVEEAVRIARGVAAALDHAHRNGIVHRDIKPANVLVPEHGPVKVTDFGIAKAEGSGDITRTGTVVGTAKYLAPEQVQAAPVDARTDVYAVGLLLFEMLAGRSAFQGGTDMENALARLTTSPPPLRALRPDVPNELEAITTRCLALDPANRFPDAATLRAALDALSDDDDGATRIQTGGLATGSSSTPLPPPPLTAAHPAPTRAPRRKRRTGSAILWMIVGILLLVGGAIGGYLVVNAARDDSSTSGASATGVAPKIVGVTDFDPEGDTSEHPETTGNVTDGDPSTAWTTEHYESRNFGGLKSGVGLRFALEQSSDVSSVEVQTEEGGWTADVYVADQQSDSLAGWGSPVGSIDGSSATGRVELDSPASGSAVLVWFTQLPPSGQIAVDEVHIG